MADNGEILWEKNYGGASQDAVSTGHITQDGGFIIGGNTESDDSHVGENNGKTDYWIIKLDSNGDLIWKGIYGGSNEDWLYDIQELNDGKFVAIGATLSGDDDVGNNYGGPDFWIILLDEDGDLVWEQNYGGTNTDVAFDIELTNNYGFIVAGGSHSSDIDVEENNGNSDFWLINFSPLSTSTSTIFKEQKFDLYPNPSNGGFSIYLTQNNNIKTTIEVFNSLGYLVYSENTTTNQVYIEKYPKGLYLVQVSSNEYIESKKLIIH